MADTTTVPKPFTLEDMGETIAAGIAAGIAQNQPRKVPYGVYIKKHNKQFGKLRRPCFQNNYEIRNVSPDLADLFNRVTHSGRYLNRTVEVRVAEEAGDTSVNLYYHNKTADQRFANTQNFTSLLDMMRKIVAVQEEEDARDAAKIEKRT